MESLLTGEDQITGMEVDDLRFGGFAGTLGIDELGLPDFAIVESHRLERSRGPGIGVVGGGVGVVRSVGHLSNRQLTSSQPVRFAKIESHIFGHGSASTKKRRKY